MKRILAGAIFILGMTGIASAQDVPSDLSILTLSDTRMAPSNPTGQPETPSPTVSIYALINGKDFRPFVNGSYHVKGLTGKTTAGEKAHFILFRNERLEQATVVNVNFSGDYLGEVRNLAVTIPARSFGINFSINTVTEPNIGLVGSITATISKTEGYEVDPFRRYAYVSVHNLFVPENERVPKPSVTVKSTDKFKPLPANSARFTITSIDKGVDTLVYDEFCGDERRGPFEITFTEVKKTASGDIPLAVDRLIENCAAGEVIVRIQHSNDYNIAVNNAVVDVSEPTAAHPGLPQTPHEPVVEVSQEVSPIIITAKPEEITEGDDAHFVVSATEFVERKEYWFIMTKEGDFFDETVQNTERARWFPGNKFIQIPTRQGDAESGFITLALEGKSSVTATVYINGIDVPSDDRHMEQAPDYITKIDADKIKVNKNGIGLDCIITYADGNAVTLKKRGLENKPYEVSELCNAVNPHSPVIEIRIVSVPEDSEVVFAYNAPVSEQKPTEAEVRSLAAETDQAGSDSPDVGGTAGAFTFKASGIETGSSFRHFSIEADLIENITFGVSASRLDEHSMTVLRPFAVIEHSSTRLTVAGATADEFKMAAASIRAGIAQFDAGRFGIFSAGIDGYARIATYKGVTASDFGAGAVLEHKVLDFTADAAAGTEGIGRIGLEYAATDRLSANVRHDRSADTTRIGATLKW